MNLLAFLKQHPSGSHSPLLGRGVGGEVLVLCAILEEFQDQSSFSFSESDIQSVPAHEWQS